MSQPNTSVGPTIAIKGCLHRNRYLPGEQLKCTVVVSCVGCDSPLAPSMSSSDKRHHTTRPYTPSVLDSTCTPVLHIESPSKSTQSPAVEILSCTAQFVGVCAVDSSRVVSLPSEHQEQRGWWASLFGQPADTTPTNRVSPTANDLQLRVVSPSSVGRTDVTSSLTSSPLVSLFDASRLGASSADTSPSWESQFKVGESHSAMFTLTLPSNVPPSMRTSLVRYVYGIHVTCSWKAAGAKASSTTHLRIPIRIFSPVAAICALQPPFESSSTGFDFNVKTFATRGDISSGTLQLPSVESPFSPQLVVGRAQKDVTPMGLLETITDTTAMMEIGFKTRASTGTGCPVEHAKVVQTAYNGSSMLSGTISDYTMRCLVYQDTVAVGAVLRGCLLCPTLRGMLASTVPHSKVEEAVRVSIELECLELAPKANFRPGTSMVPQQADARTGFVVISCTTVEEREIFVSHCTELVPFEIPLTGPKIQQSIQTDIIAIQWRLRVSVECTELLSVLSATQPPTNMGPQSQALSATKKALPLIVDSTSRITPTTTTYIDCNEFPSNGRRVGGISAILGVRITAPPTVQSSGPIGPYVFSGQ